MRKQFLFFILSIIFSSTSIAQYYYNDIVSNKKLIEERATLQEQKKRTVTVKSFEAYGEESKGFVCDKKISKDYKKMETFTKSPSISKSILTSYFNDKGLLIKSTDSSKMSASTTLFSYDDNNNIVKIQFSSRSTDEGEDDDNNFVTSLTEERQYIYNDKNLPIKLLRIRNNKDTTIFNFILDEDGNVSEEDEVAFYGQHYYYYYNDKNLLSDIVRYNVVKERMIPDFMFEYDSKGQLIQMTVTDNPIKGSYYYWKYTYDNNLKLTEKCFSKERKLIGHFEYEYK